MKKAIFIQFLFYIVHFDGQELNLYTENFSAMATQAAVLAGFTTTCFIEISLPDGVNPYAKSFLHISAIFSICSNITCVSLSTITNIWGSSKALRGKDGSMDEAVEGINDERALIFRAFAFGLMGNLCTVMGACLLLMDFPVSIVAASMVLFAGWNIYGHATRIQKKFYLSEAVRLDDLTSFPSTSMTVSTSDYPKDLNSSKANTRGSKKSLLADNV
jgi:hypothetical protein